nr:hypothetical protein [Mycoplasmopsis bovis]
MKSINKLLISAVSAISLAMPLVGFSGATKPSEQGSGSKRRHNKPSEQGSGSKHQTQKAIRTRFRITRKSEQGSRF